MKYIEFVGFYFLLSLFISCSSPDMVRRFGKDISLSSKDYETLNGIYSNIPSDSNLIRNALFCQFRKVTKSIDSSCWQNYYDVRVSVDSPNLLKLELIYGDISLDETYLDGKFDNGYFKVKRKYNFDGVAGPLLWVFSENLTYFGLSKDNNLIVLNSGGTGALFFTLLPLYVTGGDTREFEYYKK